MDWPGCANLKFEHAIMFFPKVQNFDCLGNTVRECEWYIGHKSKKRSLNDLF